MTHILDSLGWALLHSLWQGALAFAFIFLFRALSQKSAPSLRYNVQFMTLAGCLAAFIATFAIYLNAGARGESVGAVLTQTLRFIENAGSGSPVTDMSGGGLAAYLQGFGRYAPALGIFWCLGFAVMSSRYVLGFVQTQHLRNRGLQDVPVYWANRFRTMLLNSGLSEKVRLYISDNVAGPMTIGFFRPVVLVPASFLSGLPQDQVEAILLHELAHIRRYDYAVNLLQTAIKTILFFHPAVHYISRRIDIDREQACDDLAVAQSRNPHALAKGLASLRLRHSHGFAMAADDGQSPLLDRLQRLTGNTNASRRFEPAVMMTLMTLLMGSALLASAPMADAHPVPSPEPQPEPKKYEHAKASEHNYRFETANFAGREITVKITEDGSRWVMADNHWVNIDEQPSAINRLPAIPQPPKPPQLKRDCDECFAKKMDQFQIDMEYFQRDMERFSEAQARYHNSFDYEAFEEEMEKAQEQREAAMERAEEQREYAEEQREAAMERAEEQREAAMERAEEQRERAEEARERAMEDAAEARERVFERAQEERERAFERAEESRRKAHEQADKHHARHNALRKSLYTELKNDGYINSGDENVSMRWNTNHWVANGQRIPENLEGKYCNIIGKLGIDKSKVTQIDLQPKSTHVTSVSGQSDANTTRRVTYGEWKHDTKNKVIKTSVVPSFMLPVNSRHITSGFGKTKTGDHHKGVDIKAPKGTPVYASADGEIAFVTSEPKWGHRVMIKHESSYKSLYAHMDSFTVARGQSIKAGEIIGYVGSTGQSTGPHLHFEILKNGTPINPESYIFS